MTQRMTGGKIFLLPWVRTKEGQYVGTSSVPNKEGQHRHLAAGGWADNKVELAGWLDLCGMLLQLHADVCQPISRTPTVFRMSAQQWHKSQKQKDGRGKEKRLMKQQRERKKKREDAGRNKYKHKIRGHIRWKEAVRKKQSSEGTNGRKLKA